MNIHYTLALNLSSEYYLPIAKRLMVIGVGVGNFVVWGAICAVNSFGQQTY